MQKTVWNGLVQNECKNRNKKCTKICTKQKMNKYKIKSKLVWNKGAQKWKQSKLKGKICVKQTCICRKWKNTLQKNKHACENNKALGWPTKVDASGYYTTEIS